MASHVTSTSQVLAAKPFAANHQLDIEGARADYLRIFRRNSDAVCALVLSRHRLAALQKNGARNPEHPNPHVSAGRGFVTNYPHPSLGIDRDFQAASRGTRGFHPL